ncbi:MAG: two pore domain potassium channel family protein [Eggerthellaceae bacterium]|nr:two pore domain potassium channel family protein [Eggerthellaceae bacterium]
MTKNSKTLGRIMRTLHADKATVGFLLFFVVAALLIWLTEPTIETFPDSLWYCFSVVTSVDFGGQQTTGEPARIFALVLSLYSMLIIAIFTAVATDFVIEHAKLGAQNSAGRFLDQLERLPELSHEELVELSEMARAFNRQRKKIEPQEVPTTR